jgi:hypothetical protein
MTGIDEILTARKRTHGEFRDHARVTWGIKRVMEGEAQWARLNDIQREALAIIAHKIGRILTGDPNHHDHWDDIAGYAKLVSDRIPRVVEVRTSAELDEVLNSECVSTLARGDEIENNFYLLKAQEWAMERDEAKAIVTAALFNERPRSESRHEMFVQNETARPVHVKVRTRPVDLPPEPVSTSPWVISLDELNADPNLVNIYTMWTKGAYYLEPSITQEAYDTSAYRRNHNRAAWDAYDNPEPGRFILRIRDVPAARRHLWPTLPREVNTSERREMPEWQRLLYYWSEDESKWRLAPEHSAWAGEA